MSTVLEIADPAAVFTVIGTLVGAGIAALVAWINGLRETRKDEHLAMTARAEQRRLLMTERIGQYLAAADHAVSSLRDVALAPQHLKKGLEKSEIWPTVDRVNYALAAIQVNEPDEIVETVQRLDSAMVELAKAAMVRTFDEEEWRAERRGAMAGLKEAVVAAARAHAHRLGGAGE